MHQLMFKRLLPVVLLLASLVTPGVYARDLTIPPGTARTAARDGDERKSRVEFEYFARTELFFGTAKQDGTVVSDEDFRLFLGDTVTRLFPDGLTLLNGLGQFKDASGNIIQEKSFVLILLYPSQARKESSKKIEEIRREYKGRFNQQSVLRVDDPLPVLVSF